MPDAVVMVVKALEFEMSIVRKKAKEIIERRFLCSG